MNGIFGNQWENLTIKFLSSFKSTDGVNLFNDTVWTFPFANSKPPIMLQSTGSSLNGIATGILVAALIIKIAGGPCSPIMWGMLNQMQIIYFFPLLMLYFPQNLASFLRFLKASKFSPQLDLVSEYKERLLKLIGHDNL